MSPNPLAVEPLSNAAQTGLRLPVILFALVGAVLALVFLRRWGVLSAVLAAVGMFVVAVDQIVNVIWAYTTSQQVKEPGDNSVKIITTQNRFTIADAVLISIGVALLVVALAVHRRVGGSPAAGYPAPYGSPPAGVPGYGVPGYGPPPGYGSVPSPGSTPAGYGAPQGYPSGPPSSGAPSSGAPSSGAPAGSSSAE
jgi:hypothetical protein